MVSYLMAEYQSEAIERIAILVEKIRGKKQRVEQEGNIWPANDANTQRPYTIDEAIESVALQNKYTDEQQRQLAKVFHITLDRIPQEIKEKCSYRLLKRGRYISINLMNYLLYRSPGYGDLGGKPYYECFLIFTKDLPSHFETTGERNVFSFSHFDCVNLGLSFEEVLSLSDMGWDNFGQACQMASKARKSRSWVSNIQI